jgi:rhodanese-related sulfurtransferase
MRCMHITSGLLSIVGAAFLFGTVHALIVDPVNVGAVDTNTDGNVVGGDGPRGLDPEPAEDPIEQPHEEPAEQSSSEIADLDSLLDAEVPEGMLTLRQGHELWEQGAYFLDARKEDEFIAGHIEYAEWLPSTLFDTDSDRAFAVAESMPPESTVVIYCVGGDCDASHNTARRLQEIGFTDLRIMGAGYDQWVEAGMPITQGGAP